MCYLCNYIFGYFFQINEMYKHKTQACVRESDGWIVGRGQMVVVVDGVASAVLQSEQLDGVTLTFSVHLSGCHYFANYICCFIGKAAPAHFSSADCQSRLGQREVMTAISCQRRLLAAICCHCRQLTKLDNSCQKVSNSSTIL